LARPATPVTGGQNDPGASGRAHHPTRSLPRTGSGVARARGPPLWHQAPERGANRDDAPAPVPEFVFDQRVRWLPSAASPRWVPSPSHGLAGHALSGSPKTVTLTRPSARCPTLDWPQARIPSASPAPAGQPDTRVSPPATRDTVGIPILYPSARSMGRRSLRSTSAQAGSKPRRIRTPQ